MRNTLSYLSAAVILVVAGVGVVFNVAYADRPVMVTICHFTSSETNPWVEITAAYPAIYGPAGHFSEPGTTNAGHENDFEGPCLEEPTNVPEPTSIPDPTATPTDAPQPTPTPSDEPGEPTPTPTDEGCYGECDPTEVPTPTPIDPPTPVETPELPKAGFTSQMELINGEPWIVMVNEQTTVWAAHNQEGWPAASWWQLFVGVEFYWEYGDNPGWYRVTNYILAEPTDVHLIYTTEPDLILLTCRGYDPATNQWAQRLVLYAEVSP